MLLSSFSAAPGCRAMGSPAPAPLCLCQRAAWTVAGFISTLPPSWNPTGPVAVLSLSFMIFSCSSEHNFDAEGASGFLLCLQGEFQTYLWDIASRICLSQCPLKSQVMGLFSSSFPHQNGCFGQFSIRLPMLAQTNSVRDVLSRECLCLGIGYTGSIAQITRSVCSLHL